MFRFFLGVIKFLAGLGFKGFRCDEQYVFMYIFTWFIIILLKDPKL